MDLTTDMLIIPPPQDQSKDFAIMKIVNNEKIHRNVSCEAPKIKLNVPREWRKTD